MNQSENEPMVGVQLMEAETLHSELMSSSAPGEMTRIHRSNSSLYSSMSAVREEQPPSWLLKRLNDAALTATSSTGTAKQQQIQSKDDMDLDVHSTTSHEGGRHYNQYFAFGQQWNGDEAADGVAAGEVSSSSAFGDEDDLTVASDGNSRYDSSSGYFLASSAPSIFRARNFSSSSLTAATTNGDGESSMSLSSSDIASSSTSAVPECVDVRSDLFDKYGTTSLAEWQSSSWSKSADAQLRRDMASLVIDEIETLHQATSETCSLCGKPLIFSPAGDSLSCATPNCTHHILPVRDATVSSLPFVEEVFYSATFNRSNANKPVHGNRRENDIFGRTRSVVSENVVEYMRLCIKASLGKKRDKDITIDEVFQCAKVHGWTALYHEKLIPVFCRITGNPMPLLEERQKRSANDKFSLVWDAYWHKGCKPPERKNFMDYLYVWYKIYEMIGERHLLVYIRLLDEKNLETQDAIFEKICVVLGSNWKFIPTIPRPKAVIKPLTDFMRTTDGSAFVSPELVMEKAMSYEKPPRRSKPKKPTGLKRGRKPKPKNVDLSLPPTMDNTSLSGGALPHGPKGKRALSKASRRSKSTSGVLPLRKSTRHNPQELEDADAEFSADNAMEDDEDTQSLPTSSQVPSNNPYEAAYQQLRRSTRPNRNHLANASNDDAFDADNDDSSAGGPSPRRSKRISSTGTPKQRIPFQHSLFTQQAEECDYVD